MGSKVDDVINVYEDVLKGKTKIFPHYFWGGEEGKRKGIRVFKYLIEEKLNLSDEEIKTISLKFFVKYKLSGMIIQCFNNSPSQVIMKSYPNRFKIWELSRVPLNYWNEKTAKEAIKYLIEEKLKWSRNDILNKLEKNVILENGYGSPLQIFNNSCSKAIMEVYPDTFKPWEFKVTYKGFWNDSTIRDALKWLIEEKLKWNKEDIRNNFKRNIMIENGLGGVLEHFNSSPYAAINFLYPNEFQEWELGSVIWTKEKVLLAAKWLFEEKLGLTKDTVLENVRYTTFLEYGLTYALKYYNNDIKKLYSDVYGFDEKK